MKQFENEYVSVSLDNGIMLCSYKPGIIINLDVAKKIVADRLKFADGVPYPVLIDFSNLKSVTKEARDYMNSPEGGLKGLTCGAFIGGNAVATLFINLYLKINKPTIPTAFFSSREEAINWIKERK